MMNNGNNMMGMGRGAGGMMMPGGQGIPQMGMPGMPNAMTANLQAQQLMQQESLQNNNSQQIMEIILRKLQQEPPRPGWWRGVGTSERVSNTQKVLFAFLRGLGMDLGSALNNAQAFESKHFNASQTKEHYDMAIRNQIQQIGIQAQQRGAVPGLGQPTPGAHNMAMPGGQRNPLLNQGFNPNMLNQNLQPTMMPNNIMAPQPQPGQLPAGMMANNTRPNAMQIAQARANGMPMQPQVTLSPQEQYVITQMAERLYNQWGPNEKEAAKARLSPHELMALQSRNEDPVRFVCQKLAMANYQKLKQNQIGQQMGIPNAQFGGTNGIGGIGPTMNGQAQGLLGNPNGAQMGAGPGQAGARPPHALPPAFRGNVEDFIGQQAKAMQEQQEGRPVVPASQQRPAQTGLGLPPNNMNPAQQQQHNAALQQALNNQRLMQNRMPQTGMQGPVSTAQGVSIGQQPTPQPSPAPQALNRGPSQTPRLENSNQQPSQLRGPPQSMQTPRVGPPQNQNQHPSSQSAQPPQNKMSPQAVAAMKRTLSNMGMPEALQMKLAQLSPADQSQFMANWRNQQQLNLRNNQAPTGQLLNPNQQPPNATPSLGQPATTQSPAQPAAVSQPPMHNIGLRPGIVGPKRMTPEGRAWMDSRAFPPRVLQLEGLKGRVNTDQIKTWGQLKTWLTKASLPPEIIARVMGFQEKEFEFLQIKAQQQRQQQEKLRQQQPPSAQPTQPTQPAVPTSQPSQQQTQQQQQQQQQQPQKPSQVTNMPTQPSLSITGQPDTKAQEARTAQQKRGADAEQFQKFFLSLPDDLSSEMCNQLRTKSLQFRDKSDETIREAVAMQKRKIRQFQMLQQQRQQQQQQQLRDSTAMQNGQGSGVAFNQTTQGPQMQSKASTNQSSLPTPKQQVTGASAVQPPMAQPTSETASELRRAAQQNMSKSGLESQRPLNAQTTVGTQGGKAGQTGQPQQSAIPSPPDSVKMRRFQQLANEVRLAYRPGPVQNMTPPDVAKMHSVMDQLRPFLPIRIMNHLFYFFAHVDPGNEGPLRQFFYYRAALVDQYKDEKCIDLKDYFTVPLESAERSLGAFKSLFNRVRQHEMQTKAASAMTQAKAPATGALAPPSMPTPKPAAMSTKSKAERPPDAPTSETPPNSFHSGPSPPQQRAPHGIPTYYNANMPELTPDQLVLPDSRKRKLNNSGTPQPVKAQSPPQVPKSVPQAAPAVKPEPMFRCSHPGCEYYRRSFPTGELLARHIEEAHKEKEPEDGLQFALEMARIALNLDVNGKAIKTAKMEKTASAQTMKKSASTQSQVLKVEGSVSMSRGTTQTSNLGVPRTPQSMGRSWDKAAASKPEIGKDPLTPDSWADCPVTPTELASLFPAPEAVQGTLDLSGLTPASTLASGKSERNTPNSDVADNIAVVPEDAEDRIPLSFSNDILGINEDTSFMDDELLDLEWEEAFGSSKKRKTDASGGFNSDLFSFSFPDDEVSLF